MTFEEVKEMFKKSIDTTDTMNQAIENLIQSIYLKGYNDALNTVEVEQEPKMGHWEWLTEDKYRCSNCNSETRVDECMNEPMYIFCPFCGARMESEDKE